MRKIKGANYEGRIGTIFSVKKVLLVSYEQSSVTVRGSWRSGYSATPIMILNNFVKGYQVVNAVVKNHIITPLGIGIVTIKLLQHPANARIKIKSVPKSVMALHAYVVTGARFSGKILDLFLRERCFLLNRNSIQFIPIFRYKTHLTTL